MLSSLAHPKDRDGDLVAMLQAVGQCWLQGRTIAWSHFTEKHWRKVALPTYPFERKKHWIAARTTTMAPMIQEPVVVPHEPQVSTLLPVTQPAVGPFHNGNGHRRHAQPATGAYAGNTLAEIFAHQLAILEQQIDVLDKSEPLNDGR